MTTETQPQIKEFQAETKQVLRLVIHSMYSHKEIFLRELISNASDACEKLRFEALAKPDLLGADALSVTLKPDAAAGTLSIKDNGVGMSEAEVILKVGRPDVEAKGRGKQGHRWSYMPTAGDPDTLTTLTLAGGKVTQVERKVVR